ncbi:MAG: hypothetical protein R3E83_12530 [Burkholderiaceae bacterium]
MIFLASPYTVRILVGNRRLLRPAWLPSFDVLLLRPGADEALRELVIRRERGELTGCQGVVTGSKT